MAMGKFWKKERLFQNGSGKVLDFGLAKLQTYPKMDVA